MLAGLTAADRPDARHRSLQHALIAGAAFAALLASHGLTLDLDALTAIRALDAGVQAGAALRHPVLLAPAPPGDWQPRPQPGECEAAEWASAAACSTASQRGDASAIFPTKRNLERLAQHRDVASSRGRRARSSARDDHSRGSRSVTANRMSDSRGSRLSGHQRAAGDGISRLSSATAARTTKGPRRCRGPFSFACRG